MQWRWYLDELSGIDVVSACLGQLGKLRAIVDECEQRFQADSARAVFTSCRACHSANLWTSAARTTAVHPSL